MTIEEFKAYPNCSHYTDEQAESILRTLDNLATIIFDYTCLKNGMLIDNQLDRKDNNADI